MEMARKGLIFVCLYMDVILQETSEISCSTRNIISYFQAFMYCSVYYIYKTIVLSPPKDRAVNSNAFDDNRHM